AGQGRAEPLTCDDFLAIIDETGRIGAAIPGDLPPEERCRRMPPGCGRGFTDNGRAWTWYYRSVCFEGLAMERLDPVLCDEVVERPSFLMDGSYYSPLACRARVAERLEDRAAGPMVPGDMARLTGLEAALGEELSVTLHLAPARLAGRYAVALGLAWVEEDGTEVYSSLNPEGLEWAEALDRLHPITGWHVEIAAGQETLTLTVAPRHLEDARRTLAAGWPVRLEVRLQALMDERGRVLAPDLPSTAAQSRQSVRI
ncbi:MAG TPA: hypothetical protein VMM55_03360, partial [Thermohalobaculum sp.]|nr:hypothetical protein [Thermohalobaculum sp.]